MRRFTKLLFFTLFISMSAKSQDSCSVATLLCANSKITASNVGATVSLNDPPLSCGDMTLSANVWFAVTGINNGTATITVSKITNNPGLEMQVYTGTCGSLVSTGQCATGIGPNGSMSVTISTTPGTVYYIMVNGTGGNQETFDILATSSSNSIIARPDANFNADPTNGCIPLSVDLENTSTIYGGTNITYQWQFDGGSFVPSGGSDTTIDLTTAGTHNITLEVCNNECGCKSASQNVIAQQLVPTIGFSPATSCVGTPIHFTGSGAVLPTPPFVNPNITSWQWNFGDPSSGANNTSSTQNPTHTFVGAGPSFTVQLIVQGICGTDTATTTVTLNPQPVLHPIPDQTICQGSPASLTLTVDNAVSPIIYSWSGSGTITCNTCASTSVTGLAPTGPYTFSISITDKNGCIADSTTHVTVDALPVVNAGNDTTVCKYSMLTLTPAVTGGHGQLKYHWSPAAGLNDSTLKNPTASITGDITYCLTVTDSLGCASVSACVTVDIYPPPSISSSHATYCASDPGPDSTTFTVNGAHTGSSYSWKLSPNYSLITGTNVDSSSVKATFPAGTTGTYHFTVIVNDPVTGCADTVFTTFTVVSGIIMSVNGPFTICKNEAVVLIAEGPTTFAWTAIPHYSFADSTLANQNVSPIVTTHFVVKGAIGTCTTVDTVVVTVNPLPIAKADSINSFCGCTTVSLSGTGSSAGMNYLWTSAGGSIIANPTSQFTTATICSSDVFTLTVTDSVTGCSKSTSIPAISRPKPAAKANANPLLICNGTSTSVALNGTGSNTTTGTTYLWTSVPVVSIANSTALITSATVTGFTVFSLTVTDSAGCDSVVSAAVNIYPPPSLSATPGSLCTSSPSMIDTISITGASSGSTYNWTVIPACATPHSTSAQSQIFNFSTCGVGTYNFTVAVTDSVTGCVDTLNASVDVISGVMLTASPNQTICQGDTVILNASGANTYIWSNGSTNSTIVVTGLTPAMSPDTITVAGTVGSCNAVDTIIVTINPRPVTSSINGPLSVCQNDTTTAYSVTNHAGDIYTWSVTNGTVTSGQGTDSIIVKWGTPGVATLSVQETNSLTCAGTPQTITVTINPNPVTSPITGPDSVCSNTTQQYSVTSVAGSSYQWVVSGGSFSGPSTNNSAFITWGSGPAGKISVVETNSGGCAGDTVSSNITILPPPLTPVIVGPDTLCADSAGVTYSVTDHVGSVYIWTVTGGTLTSGQDSATITVTWGGAGTGTIQVTETNGSGCPSSPAMLTVVLDTVPITSPINGSNSVCPNDSDIYIVSASPGNTFTWAVTGGNLSSGQGTDTIKVNWGTAGSGTITVSQTNPSGCPSMPQSLSVTINPKPITSAVTGLASACQNSTQAYYVDGSAGSVYQWIVAGGVITGSATDSLVSITWGAPPAGTIEVVETNPSGCAGDTVTLNVTILATPAMPVITGADTLCADTMGIVYSVVNHGGSYYLWTVTGGTIAPPSDSSNQVTVNWGNAGVDTVQAIEVNANGCSSTPAILIVKLDSTPATTPIVGDTAVCANDSGVVYAVNNIAGDIYNWNVTGGSIASGQGTNGITVNWAGQDTGTVTVLETTPKGCAGMLQSQSVFIRSTPDSTRISGPDSVCESATVSYTVTGDTASTFFWNVTNGTLIGSNTGSVISVTWGTPGAGLLQVKETSKYGCPGAPVFLNITVNPVPHTSPITGNDTVCINDTGNIYFVTPTAGSTYGWSVSGGTIASGQGTDTISVTWNNAGADTVTVVETNGTACPGIPVTDIVVVNAKPFAGATASVITLCQKDSVHVTGVDSNAVSVGWLTSGSGTFTNDTALSTTYIAGATDSGTIVLKLVAHNPPCADDTATVTLTVNPIPHITIMPASPSICLGATDTLFAGGIGSYMWTPGNDTTMSIIVHPDSTTTYTVKITNTYGCFAQDSDVVTIIPPGSANAGPDQFVCRGDSVQLNGIVANAGGGMWTTTGDGTFVPDSVTLNASYIPGSNDTSVAHLVLTTTGACLNSSDTLKITFSNTPTVNAGLNQTINHTDSAHLNGVVTNAGGGIWTSSGTGLFVPSDTTLTASYIPSYTDLQMDSIILTLTSINGCKAVSAFIVIHFSEFTIPNVFTPYPNSPGYNDYFEIKGLPPDSRLKVWNRWGLLVYTSDDYHNNWDAVGLPSDVYYYIILTPSNEYHGWVQVIKE